MRAHPGDERFPNRTISAAAHPRGARPLWSESGRWGGVSDSAGGGRPTAGAGAASASRSPLARTRNVAKRVARQEITWEMNAIPR